MALGLIVSGKTFKSGNSEAVRLPKDMGFGINVEVTIERRGNELVIRPKMKSMAEVIAELDALPRPDTVEVRDPDIFPERPGL
jgi:antitoxin VapB